MGNFLYGGERARRFVKVHLHCIVRNLKKISEMSTLPPLEKFLRTPMDVDDCFATPLAPKAACCVIFV